MDFYLTTSPSPFPRSQITWTVVIVVALRRQYKIQAKSSEMVVNCRLRVADVLSESLSSERLKDNRSVEGLSLKYSTFSLVIL